MSIDEGGVNVCVSVCVVFLGVVFVWLVVFCCFVLLFHYFHMRLHPKKYRKIKRLQIFSVPTAWLA